MGIYLGAWKVMENPFKKDDEQGYPHDLGNLHIMNWALQPR